MEADGEPQQPGTVDIVILTAIAAELDAACRVLQLDDRRREKVPDGTVYFRSAVHSELVGRDYSVVLTCIGGAGNPGAAAATASAIAAYRPRAVLLMGIAAGIRDRVRIGDVVISDRIVAYEPAALVRSARGMKTQPRPEIDRTPHAMLQDVVSYRPEPGRISRAFTRAGGAIPPAVPGKEDEFAAHVATVVTARQGTIASGAKLLRDPARLFAMRELHGKAELGEMEAAGVVDGCRRGQVPWLVFRGISDFGDELKDDRFHAFAACAAAAVLYDFIARGLDLGAAAADLRTGHEHAHVPTGNPYVFGRAIDRDDDFVGRIDERRWLREAIDKRQPVQLVGERLMGKTSLLRWVERNVFLGRPVVWLDPSRGVTPAVMVRSIARALGKHEVAAQLDSADATSDQAGKVLDALVPFVLLVDDGDALCSRGQGFDDGFLEALRAHVQRGDLTWVSASRRSLYDAFRARGLTSRFLNDALLVRVGMLSRTAALDLASRGAQEEVAGRMVETAAGFAFGLQWLGDFLCRRPGQIDQACDAFVDGMASIFGSWWSGVEPEDRRLAKRCVLDRISVTALDDNSRRRLRGLKERGFVDEHDSRFIIDGATWRNFVADAE